MARSKGGMSAGRAKMVAMEEREDSSMMKKGAGCANMPQEINYRPWADVMQGLDMNMDDTIKGVDRQMDADHKKLKSQVRPIKY